MLEMDIAYCELLEGVILFAIQYIYTYILWDEFDEVGLIRYNILRPRTRISTVSLSHAEDE